MRGMLGSVLLVAVFVVLFWGAGRLFGFQVSLVWSLAASIVLTVVANLVLRLFRR